LLLPIFVCKRIREFRRVDCYDRTYISMMISKPDDLYCEVRVTEGVFYATDDCEGGLFSWASANAFGVKYPSEE